MGSQKKIVIDATDRPSENEPFDIHIDASESAVFTEVDDGVIKLDLGELTTDKSVQGRIKIDMSGIKPASQAKETRSKPPDMNIRICF